MERSMSNKASMRRTASSAAGEIAPDVLPRALRRALASISARTKNLRRANEASSLQALGVQRGAQPIVPEDLDQLAALAPEDVKVAGMRVALQRLLDAQGQRVHAAAHVRVTGRDPHSHA
jgi:hypothetical protein